MSIRQELKYTPEPLETILEKCYVIMANVDVFLRGTDKSSYKIKVNSTDLNLTSCNFLLVVGN